MANGNLPDKNFWLNDTGQNNPMNQNPPQGMTPLGIAVSGANQFMQQPQQTQQPQQNQQASFGGFDSGGGQNLDMMLKSFGVEGVEDMTEAEKMEAFRSEAQAYGRKQMAPNLLLGGIQTAGGIAGLLTQGDIPEYQEPERLQQAYNKYGQIAQQGLPEVNQAYQQRIERNINTGRQEAMDQAGPSTANAINAAVTTQNLEGQRKLAEMEADQKMKGLQQQTQVAQTLRNLQDQRTQQARQRYGQEEAAFGGAAMTGSENLVEAFNMATGIGGALTGNPLFMMSNMMANQQPQQNQQ